MNISIYYYCAVKLNFNSIINIYILLLYINVNPLDTCGYTNVVIMAGINDLKSNNVKTPHDVRVTYNILTPKIRSIQYVNERRQMWMEQHTVM